MNGNWGRTLPMGFNSWDAPAHAGRSNNWAGSAQLRHTAYLKSVILSTTSFGYSQNSNESSPYLALPSASVRITSDFVDGSSNVRSILVGGNTSLGSTSTTTNLQLRNALSWISMDGLHKLTLTTELARNLSMTDQSSNLFGSFSFNSLADFEAGRPSSFSRTLTPRRQGRSQGTLGISLGDAWRPNPDLNLTYGVRVDASRFGSGPEFNPLVEQVFGLRNDRVPNPDRRSARASASQKSFGESPQIAIGDGFMRGPRQRVAGGIGDLPGIAGAVAHESSDLQYGSAERDSAADVRGRRDADAGLGTSTASMRRVCPSACADGTSAHGVRQRAARRDARRSRLSGVAPTERGPELERLGAAQPVQSQRGRQLRAQSRSAGRDRLEFRADAAIRAGETKADVRCTSQPTSIVPTTGSIASGDARVSQNFSRVTFINSGSAVRLQTDRLPALADDASTRS